MTTDPRRPAAKRPSGTRAAEFPVAPTTRQPADALGVRANRTIARILDAAREAFLASGYEGTTIDEITTAAGLSRASFYTYFPTKRDVLLAVGARSAGDSIAVIRQLENVDASIEGMTEWVGQYFSLLDEHGAFAFAWTQAAQNDPEIRVAGMRSNLSMCRQLGKRLAALGNTPASDPVLVGLTTASAMERAWDYSRLYAGSIERSSVIAHTAVLLWGSIHPDVSDADSVAVAG